MSDFVCVLAVNKLLFVVLMVVVIVFVCLSTIAGARADYMLIGS